MRFGISRNVVLLGLGFVAAAQAHAENKTDGEWRGSGGAALSYSSGNTNSTSVAVQAAAERATVADKVSLGAHLDYGRSRADEVTSTTSNQWNASGQYDFNLALRTYAFGKLAFESDRVAFLDLRSGINAGLGYKLIDTKETLFNVFAGLGYSSDNYSRLQTIGSRAGTHFSRTSAVVGEEYGQQLTPTTSVKQRLEVSPGLSGDQATLSKLTAGVSVAMTRTLSLAVNLQDTYNSHPPDGQKNNDLTLFTGINVKLGAP